MNSSDISFINFFLIGLCGLVTLIYLWLRKTYSYWERKDVAHVKAESFIFGNIKSVLFKKSILYQIYDDIYNRFPNKPYCGLYEFHYPVLLLRDPDVIETVTAKMASHFMRNKVSANESADSTFVHDPFLQSGDRWRESRAIIRSAFSPRNMKFLEDLNKTYAEDMFKYIDESTDDVEAFDVCVRHASEMVANFGWGIKSDGFSEDSTFRHVLDKAEHFTGLSFVIMVLNPFLSCILKLGFFSKELTSFIQHITKKSIDLANSSTRKDMPKTFLQSVKSAKEKYVKDVTIKELSGLMGSFLMDGYDTSARAASYIIYILMMHPEEQKILKEEILQLDEITIESVRKLRYLEMVFNETFRFCPIVPFTIRLCNKNCKIGDLEVEAGTPIVVPFSSIQKDATYYPNPHVFNPENFSEENVNKRPKFTNFPFGVGARLCIGKNYGLVSVKLLVCYILKRYDILPPKNHPVCPISPHIESFMVLVNKDPLYVTFKKTI